ncbi:MAG TPA: ribosome biogenesis factor YjgA [Gammaproteobacteria bacterium]|jgi:ribosome-associated protein|nr:ribosome biogenesis factor YjgA [Gammaproteobacteria bacterium]
MPLSDNQPPDETSKSQRKRDMDAIQKLANTLAALPNSQLAKMPLPEGIITAIRFSHTLKAHGAKRRHMHYIGKLMREEDLEPVRVALKMLERGREQDTAKFHAVEQWRDRLLQEGDEAIQVFLADYPSADRQQLRQLVRKAQLDKKNNKNTGADTELFRMLKALMV